MNLSQCKHDNTVNIDSCSVISKDEDGKIYRHLALTGKCTLCGNPMMFTSNDFGLRQLRATVSQDRMTMLIPFKFVDEVFTPVLLTVSM